MQELLSLVLDLSCELKTVRAYLEVITKSKMELLRDSWLDANGVIAVLRISKRTLQHLRKSGQLPFSKVNGKIYYKMEDIEKLLESNYTTLKD